MNITSLVRAEDFRQPWFAERARELNEPLTLHRKLWEFAVICQTFKEHLGDSHQGGYPEVAALGFGVGKEPIASWLAAQGAYVLATDRPDPTQEWTQTGQHAQEALDLWHPKVCSQSQFSRVAFSALDMNSIPKEVTAEYDFTWSCGSFEHLGSVERGLIFFCEQMRFLRPGGIAVHTTEYNADWHRPTLNMENLVLFRIQELEALAKMLEAQGDRLQTLKIQGGSEPADFHIDRAPYGIPHLKLALGSFITTSIVLVARRGGR